MSYHNVLGTLNSRSREQKILLSDSRTIAYNGVAGSSVFGSSFQGSSTISDRVVLFWNSKGNMRGNLFRDGQTQEISADWIRGIPKDIQSSPDNLASFLEDTYVTLDTALVRC